jgi:hypothetical protein
MFSTGLPGEIKTKKLIKIHLEILLNVLVTLHLRQTAIMHYEAILMHLKTCQKVSMNCVC